MPEKDRETQRQLTASELLVPDENNALACPQPKRALTKVDSLKERIIEGHLRTTVLAAASAISALETGDALLQAKKVLGHGEFLPWIDNEITPECGLSRRTLQRYTQLAKNRGKLIRQIRKIHANGDGNQLDEESAVRVLNAMKMKDALNLLNLRGNKEKRVKNDGETGSILTPTPVIEAATAFLGEIDLDPCADTKAAHHVPAKRVYTQVDNGLAPDNAWEGRVFLHPPQDASLCDWVDRAIHEFSGNSITEAVVLLPAETAASWMPLLDACPRVFLWDPLKCPVAGAGTNDLSFTAVVVAIARRDRLPAFHAAFNSFGQIMIPYSPHLED